MVTPVFHAEDVGPDQAKNQRPALSLSLSRGSLSLPLLAGCILQHNCDARSTQQRLPLFFIFHFSFFIFHFSITTSTELIKSKLVWTKQLRCLHTSLSQLLVSLHRTPLHSQSTLFAHHEVLLHRCQRCQRPVAGCSAERCRKSTTRCHFDFAIFANMHT